MLMYRECCVKSCMNFPLKKGGPDTLCDDEWFRDDFVTVSGTMSRDHVTEKLS